MTSAETTDYFRDLYELTSDRDRSLEEKIARAIALGRDRLGLDYGVLSRTGDGEYEVVDSTIESGDFEPETVHDLDETWCRHVVEDGELFSVADAGDSAYADDVAREATGLSCYIGAPLVVDDEVYGTLCYSSDEPPGREFSEDEERFVELLAQWISHEIDRERQQQELERQNQRLDEFAGILTHDLRNPLTVARGYAELAAESASGEQAANLERVLDAVGRMETLVTDVLSLARDDDAGQQEPVEFEAAVEGAWRTVEPTGATLTVEGEEPVFANRSRLGQLFENLFRNVDQHCGPGTAVVARRTDDGFVVADDGPGLPPAVAENFCQFGGSGDRHGLGLLIVERIVAGHGWAADVESDESGTRFEFTGVEAARPERPSV